MLWAHELAPFLRAFRELVQFVVLDRRGVKIRTQLPNHPASYLDISATEYQEHELPGTFFGIRHRYGCGGGRLSGPRSVIHGASK